MRQNVNFYLLENDDVTSIVCRLLEKAYQQKYHVFVLCENQAAAETLDEYLWQYKPEGFLPHHLSNEGPKSPAPIIIGWDEETRNSRDILINLTETIPPFFQQFKRVFEIVAANETAKEKCREKYRMYKQQNCVIKTHELAMEKA